MSDEEMEGKRGDEENKKWRGSSLMKKKEKKVGLKANHWMSARSAPRGSMASERSKTALSS